jgi:UDP-N-acetylglucosamine diphosphorylase/glucosamine-1-phosphate N-acetyltransferase
VVGERLAYVALPPGAGEVRAQDLDGGLGPWEGAPRRAAGGALLGYPWDLVSRIGEFIEDDYLLWAGRGPARFEGVAVLGPPERFVADATARVEPCVVVDTRQGPVLVDRGAVVQAFSRLEGPCYVGPETQVLAGRVRGSSFGPQCRVGGEVEASVVQGYSNKAHDGFLGHSYVGEWVNLGAGTHTSDLRNDYGPVSVTLGGQKVETGQMKVGSFVGDHTKASIGCLFNTGSAVGPFGQLVTSGALLPRALPAFCQVSGSRVQERTDLKQMFATAATAMCRRRREWTEVHAEFFLDLYERTGGERRQLLRESEQRRQRRVV